MDMFQFFEKGMRGGTSYIAHRHSTANNKYICTWKRTTKRMRVSSLDKQIEYLCMHVNRKLKIGTQVCKSGTHTGAT
jgi:hypothetical protein